MFKLNEIEFIDHPFFNSLKVEFVNQNEGSAENYVTLIIGPNGTGKSKILQSIIGIFNSLEYHSKNPRKKYSYDFHYKLKFSNKGRMHDVDYSTDDLLINEIDSRSNVDQIILPTQVMISAFSFNDKYPLRESRGKATYENYYYLGLKSTTNNIFLSKPTRDAISNLYDAIIHDKDIAPLRAAFITLELKPELTLVYKPGKYFKFLLNNEFWENRNLTPSQFENAFSDFFRKNKRKDTNPELKRLGNEKIEKLLGDTEKIKTVIDYLQEHIRLLTGLVNKEIALKPILNFEQRNSFNEFTKNVLSFQLLSDLEIISFSRFEIKKLETNFSFDDASSGEYHIILTYLNILSLLKENSLVMLDEPEISLHPNWQIKYMDIFSKIFQDFPKTHFIIASHSHFLVSDLKSKNSNILGVELTEQGKIKITPSERNTYGWSAEQILLDVFKVATTRNYYLTRIVGDILHSLSKENFNKELVKEEIRKLNVYDIENLNENDPMKMVIKKLLAKVNS
jgi:predicted ATPase